MDKKLGESSKSHLCGFKITVSDLLIYCEIFSVLTILPQNSIKIETHGHLYDWYKRMDEIKVFWHLNNAFKDELAVRYDSVQNLKEYKQALKASI